MPKINYSWSKVVAGDIISFVYKNTKGSRLRRTILVLDPKRNGLLHGIQLEVSNIPTNPQIKKILETAGTAQIVDEDKKVYRVALDGSGKDTYKKLKGLIKRHGIYRTYKYDVARKSVVSLEDLKLPIGFIKEIKNEN
jgi:hypothetical protein|tara:strand:- start:59 stop:472 length:414 start_codon:yes stop_codon:yes gene_type:complete